MMTNSKKILFQLDCDRQSSSFDSVVAVDSGIDFLKTFDHVEIDEVEPIVHGAIFTRKVSNLKSTAMFFGGSKVNQAELLFKRAQKAFFGPMRVSLMLDAAGANTTSSAAVLAVEKHFSLKDLPVAVFAATGSVGNRVCELLGSQSANVIVASRSLAKATELCGEAGRKTQAGSFTPKEVKNSEQANELLSQVAGVFSAGAAGIQLISKEQLSSARNLKFAADLNAVPPPGIESIEVSDFAEERDHLLTFGAIGIGGLKMKIHQRCIESLFESNEHVLDLQEIYEVGKKLLASS